MRGSNGVFIKLYFATTLLHSKVKLRVKSQLSAACKPKRNKRLTNYELHRNKMEWWAKFGAEDHENFSCFFTVMMMIFLFFLLLLIIVDMQRLVKKRFS